MWTIHLKNKYGSFRKIMNFDTVNPESSGLPKRLAIAEALGFREGMDTHHFVIGERDLCEIRLIWEQITPGYNVLWFKITEKEKDSLYECPFLSELCDLRRNLINS